MNYLINYLVRAGMLAMTLKRQIKQPRITKGSQISPLISKHPSDSQVFDCTTFVWEVLSVHGNELRLFIGQGIPPTLTIVVAHLT